MNKSNQEIVRRINELEHQQSVNSAPVASRCRTQVHSHPLSMTSHSVSDPNHTHQVGLQGTQTIATGPQDPLSVGYNSLTSLQPSTSVSNTIQHQDLHDAVVPSLDALRTNPTLAQAISQISSTYEGHARLEAAQGKASTIRCSGRYNSTDLPTRPPRHS